MLNPLTKSTVIIFAAFALTLFSSQSAVADPKTVEEQMAFVDGNHGSSVKIARYRYLLNTLEKKTGESRQHIGDVTARVKIVLKEQYGEEVTLLVLLEGVNKSTPSKSPLPYLELLTAYTALILSLQGP